MVRKWVILMGALLVGGTISSLVGYAALHLSPEQVALQDYTLHKKVAKNKAQGEVGLLQLSGFSIAVDATVSAEQIQAYKGASIKDLLQPTAEKLWFAMNGSVPDGIIVANDKEPILMGGEKRSKDLLHIYISAREIAAKDEQVRYVEVEGQSLLVVLDGKEEHVFLTESAASLLNLPAGAKLTAGEVIQKIKERIAFAS
ncbi:hypothetical protein [Paenibacillus sp. 481]|uniref:hypothetical protein n=1 Tax=Paenibacillus sp. 481 TaxID=2835869 RepID=UPI001E392CB8|nr:hypothetical protein [Paenibacillus sp. 481]UHA74942.1 hypothetical protein KIK04_07875 [Paenibacillus sp. 481]